MSEHYNESGISVRFAICVICSGARASISRNIMHAILMALQDDIVTAVGAQRIRQSS